MALSAARPLLQRLGCRQSVVVAATKPRRPQGESSTIHPRPLLMAAVLTGGGLLLGAVASQNPALQTQVFLAANRVVRELNDLRSPVELFDEPEERDGSLLITHGVASGDVTSGSAVIWARANRQAELHLRYDVDPAFGSAQEALPAPASRTTDFTAKVFLADLSPGTTYHYRAWFEAAGVRSSFVDGRFQTAPTAAVAQQVAFVFSGDLGGAGYCRAATQGYAIFDAMRVLRPQFFLALGDMIYADDSCPARGPGGRLNVPGGFRGVADPGVRWDDQAEVRDIYLRHWRYNRADPHLGEFLASASMYSIWDDHEVINDAGGAWEHWRPGTEEWVGYPSLVRAGRDAFFDYAPIARDPHDPDRIYRAVRWGADMDLFLLDARSYRSRNELPDAAGAGKTMLGSRQLAWLKEGLFASTAIWKVVGSSVPLSAPTGGAAAGAFGRDGWASGEGPTGFERELLDLLQFLDAEGVRNVVFLTGDLHRPLVIRYEMDLNGDGQPLVFHEIVAGPLSAGLRDATRPDLDPTLNPQLLYHDGGFFNFGYVRLLRQADGRDHLLVDLRGEDGQPRRGSELDLAPQEPATRAERR